MVHFAQFKLHRKQLHACTVSLSWCKAVYAELIQKLAAASRATISHFPSSPAHWHQLHLDTQTFSKPSGYKLRDKLIALNGTFSFLLRNNLCLVQDICRGHNLNTDL